MRIYALTAEQRALFEEAFKSVAKDLGLAKGEPCLTFERKTGHLIYAAEVQPETAPEWQQSVEIAAGDQTGEMANEVSLDVQPVAPPAEPVVEAPPPAEGNSEQAQAQALVEGDGSSESAQASEPVLHEGESR